MSRARKYALIQGQVFLWALLAGVAYLVARNVSVAVAVVFFMPIVATAGWMVWRIRRQTRP